MARKLTIKQEAFCAAYVETGNASEAYRRSYNAGKMKPEVVAVKASELLKSGNVSVRVAELRSEIQARNKITVDSLIEDLKEARLLALATEQPSPMIAATMSMAKLLGLDKGEGDDEDAPQPVKIVVEVKDARKPDAKS